VSSLLSLLNMPQQIGRVLPKPKAPPLPTPDREPRDTGESVIKTLARVAAHTLGYCTFYICLVLVGLLWMLMAGAWRVATGYWPVIEATFPRRDLTVPPDFTGSVPDHPLTTAQRVTRDHNVKPPVGPTPPPVKTHKVGGRDVLGRSWTMDEALDAFDHEEPF
jgi:hypothetical protein